MDNFTSKLNSGEFIHEWNGFSPFYVGCSYGDYCALGGEEKFSHCYDFYCGIAEVEYWKKNELDKLTLKQQKELLHILKRNEKYLNKIIHEKGIKKIINFFTFNPYDMLLIIKKYWILKKKNKLKDKHGIK